MALRSIKPKNHSHSRAPRSLVSGHFIKMIAQSSYTVLCFAKICWWIRIELLIKKYRELALSKSLEINILYCKWFYCPQVLWIQILNLKFMLYSHYHNIDLRTSMNERTLFFIKIYISHTLFSKGFMLLWCVRDEWKQGQTAILTQLLLLTIARCVIFKKPLSTFSASWLGLLNRGSLRATVLSLQAGPHSGLPVTNWLNGRWHLPIFFHNAYLLPLLLPLIYTGSSPIDDSVKGQYTTIR